MLEDAEHGRDLSRRDDLIGASREERSKEPNERRDVAATLPQRRREERREEDLVRVGHVRRRVRLEQLRQDLEHERCELGDVLLEDDVEGREESVLESRQCRGVARRDEPGKRSVISFPRSVENDV